MPLETIPFKVRHDLEGLGPLHAIQDWSAVPVLGTELCLWPPGNARRPGSVTNRGERNEIRWESPAPFHGILELESLGSKKDGYRVTVVDRRIDRWYSFHVRDFFAAMKKVDVRNNTMDGLFKYVYKYGSYGIAAA